jgi:hypothetical protein
MLKLLNSILSLVIFIINLPVLIVTPLFINKITALFGYAGLLYGLYKLITIGHPPAALFVMIFLLILSLITNLSYFIEIKVITDLIFTIYAFVFLGLLIYSALSFGAIYLLYLLPFHYFGALSYSTILSFNKKEE